MTLDANIVTRSQTDVFRSVLTEVSREVFAVDFGEETTEALIEVLGNLDNPPRVRLLARESVLKWVRSDFVLTSAAAELLASENLGVRTTDERFENVLLITEDAVVSVVSAEDSVAGLVSDEAEFVESVRKHWSSVWESAEEFSLRTPARSRVEESLAAEFGPGVESDFRIVLDALGDTRGSGSDLDEVAVSLLVAAKNEVLLYDISKWGEDVGVASKATFSRTKKRLGAEGLIETEKVPIDVGRPRLRLVLGDERLREADAEQLASVATSLVSPDPAE